MRRVQQGVTHTTTKLSEARDYLTATSSGELVFFAGGARTLFARASDRVDIYNVTSGNWTTATLSFPRSELAATSSQNLVFFAGGRDGTTTTTFYDRVDIYNRLNGSWSTATLSQPRYQLAATSVGNLVLFGGGTSLNGPSNVVDVFDVTSNTWTTEKLSQARARLAATSVDNRYALFGGGLNVSNPSNVVDIFDSWSETWNPVTLSQARYGLAATSLGNLAFFGGGRIDTRHTSTVVDIFNSTTQTWSTATLSQARYELAAASIGDIVAFGGGYTGSKYAATVDFYKMTDNSWFSSKITPSRRRIVAAAAVNKILFGGGQSKTRDREGVSDDVDVFEIQGKLPIIPRSEDTNDQILNEETYRKKFKINEKEIIVDSPIGSGGYGSVWKAKYRGKVVAEKVWKREDVEEEKLRKSFETELSIQMKLNHENIVKFLGYTDKPSIVLEYYEDGSLYDLLHKRKEKLSTMAQLQYALGIAKGMEYLHTRNPPIIHRDLKSNNVMLNGEVPKIIDFGVSKEFNNDTRLTTRVGTPKWMAPEIESDQNYTEKVDVWSFGVVLYELVTNKTPFDQDQNEKEVDDQILKSKTPPLPTNVEIHPTLRELMQKCWNLVPEQRPSFSEIVETLKTAITQFK